MPKGKRLVTEHLEGVSGSVLQDYPQVISDMIKQGCFVNWNTKLGRLEG